MVEISVEKEAEIHFNRIILVLFFANIFVHSLNPYSPESLLLTLVT